MEPLLRITLHNQKRIKMIRKLFLLGLPLALLTIQQVQAEERDPILEQMAQRGKRDMERLKKQGLLPKEINKADYFQNHQFTAKGKADLMRFIKSYMYIMEHNASKVPDEYKLNGLDPIEDGRSIPDTRSGLAGITFQLGPFEGELTNKDPLRFKTVWSNATINLINDYQSDVSFMMTPQDLSSIGLVFEKINLMTDQADDVPQYRSYLYVYHSRKNPDIKVSFSVSQVDYNSKDQTVLPKFSIIVIGKEGVFMEGDRVLRTVYPN